MKTALVKSVLLSTVCYLACAQTVTVQDGGWANSGIELVSFSSPQSNQLASAAVGPSLSAITPFLPYSFILRNRTTHQIAAYSALWTSVDLLGGVHNSSFVFVNPFTLGGPEAIAAGADRIVTPVPGLGYDPLPGTATLATIQNRVLTKFGGQRTVTVSLDAVVLEDGTLIGPDIRNAGPHIQGKLDAIRDVAMSVSTAIRGGADVAAIQHTLSQMSAAAAPKEAGLAAQQAAYSRSYGGHAKVGHCYIRRCWTSRV